MAGAAEKTKSTIVIKRIKKGGHAHHGGINFVESEVIVRVAVGGQRPDTEADQQVEPIPQAQQQPSPAQVQSPNQVQPAPQAAPREQEPLPAGDTGTSMD